MNANKYSGITIDLFLNLITSLKIIYLGWIEANNEIISLHNLPEYLASLTPSGSPFTSFDLTRFCCYVVKTFYSTLILAHIIILRL